jgi:patatin-like phospholipase/acyl hydrolase
VKVLSIDGGGIRGLIPAVVLAAVEERCGKRIAEAFDLLVGTSTGGILALALARADKQYMAKDLIKLYEEDGPKIFHRSLLRRFESLDGYIDELYDDKALKESLRKHLGDARLKDASCHVFITAYELNRRQAFFFRSARASGEERASQPPDAYDFPIAEVAHATSAAPTYFEPVRATSATGEAYDLIDGGVFATNPAMCAYAELRKTGAASDPVFLSLGTGTQTRQHAIDPERARGWGKLGWVRPLIDIMFDGVSDTVEFELGQLLGDRYVRLQTPLNLASEALDDASDDNLRKLRQQGDELVAESETQLDRLCSLL